MHLWKSFRRKIFRNVFVLVCFFSIVFVCYQFSFVFKLTQFLSDKSPESLVDNSESSSLSYPLRVDKNVLSPRNNFICKSSREIITLDKVNDDYCDCKDGTDETETNACKNGLFLCEMENEAERKLIPSSRINDGICDCCDGSDEFEKTQSLIKLNVEVQKKIGRYLRPCPNTCRKKIQYLKVL